MKQIVGLVLILCCTQMVAQEVFPDGKAIPEWFRENKEVNVNALGKKYSITDYGVANDSTVVQTKKIQGVIDLAARNGGGVIVIPKGTFLSGSLFFKNNTHLHLEEDASFVDCSESKHGRARLVSSTPYARRLYYHPEYDYQTDENPFAGGEWYSPWLKGGKQEDFAKKAFKQFYKRVGAV